MVTFIHLFLNKFKLCDISQRRHELRKTRIFIIEIYVKKWNSAMNIQEAKHVWPGDSIVAEWTCIAIFMLSSIMMNSQEISEFLC